MLSAHQQNVTFGTARGLEALAHHLVQNIPHRYKRRGSQVTTEQSKRHVYPRLRMVLHYYFEARCVSKAGTFTCVLAGNLDLKILHVGLYWDGSSSTVRHLTYQGGEQLVEAARDFLKAQT